MQPSDSTLLPLPDDSAHGSTEEPKKFTIKTDECGRTHTIHNGSNRAQRQEMAAIRKKAMKNAMKRFSRKIEKAKKLVKLTNSEEIDPQSDS